MSPFEYIKARRLNAVRQALVAADSSRDRVTLIALNNGFTHLGRFSVDYREHFGESPSETLARRWRGGTGGRGRKCRVASRAGGCISTLHCDSGGGRFPAIRPKHPHG